MQDGGDHSQATAEQERREGEKKPQKRGCIFFGIKMSFLWYRDGLSLLLVSRSLLGIEISFFGVEILHYVVQHLDCLLPGINQCVPFGPRHPVKWRSTKISIPKRRF